jgi:hypothetical protein
MVQITHVEGHLIVRQIRSNACCLGLNLTRRRMLLVLFKNVSIVCYDGMHLYGICMLERLSYVF